jgi:hypothetical protein
LLGIIGTQEKVEISTKKESFEESNKEAIIKDPYK